MAVKCAVVSAGCACVAGCMMLSTAFSAPGNPVAKKVAADFASRTGAKVWHYAVPPMSEIQRLSDVYPSDGTPDGTVRIVAAKDEYEPGSFLLWAPQDLGKVELEIGDFKQVEVKGGAGGKETGVLFPKENLDLKFVKVWYQNRNGWFSYFGDTGFKLCPELLVNDEDLIRVDTKTEANYARLVGKDGRKSEKWLNPPRQMDSRQLREGWRKEDTFDSMRENFRDAATLQPVALPKESFRQFFLTAHVTKDAKPGLYRGEVKIKAKGERLIGSVPVEIKVLDFELPQPKCYNEPEKDFLVSSYSYLSFAHIMEKNGYDAALARRQFIAILRNQVAHNQTMHMIRGNFNSETFETIGVMKEAGMRTDVIQGGVSPTWGQRDPDAMAARARIVADEFDRRYGHHNVYMGYGDEPGAKWLAENRPVFESYQQAGLKFFIAGETVFSKAGYFYDWHNSARDATDDTLPALWGKMQGASHVAWYANQHVGAENPAFSRRQNGLGAYLTGYTALCNYAHHLGPYNDDSTTYKPMVLAYGIYDGVLDTLAWEGFREGIDDIRYATLMTDLARKAAKSKDLKVRYLGSKAMHYLALTNAKACDMDSVRGEMIRFINELRPLVAPYDVKPETANVDVAAAKAGAARAEANLKRDVAAAVAKVREAKNEAQTNRAHVAVAEIYAMYGRQSEGGAYLEKLGLYERAADFYACLPEKMEEMQLKAYQKNKACFWSLLPRHPELLKDFDAVNFGTLKPNDTNGWKRAVGGLLSRLGGNHEYVWGEQPKLFAAVYGKAVAAARKWDLAVPAAAAKNAVWAALQQHDAKGVAEAAKEGLKDEKAKPDVRYYLGLAAALAKVNGKPAAFQSAAEAFDKTVADVPGKVRVDALCAYGSARLLAGDENAVRGLNDFRKSLYKPSPKKRYVVRFSETPVTGMADWERVTAERQTYDRQFGGNLDFLTTDVTSGERALGNSKEKLADPTMEIVCDVRGIHVLVRQADPKAKEVELGLVGNCSFEGYIAPGENTPYECFMYTPQSGHASVFNTMYATFGHRPMDPRTPERKFRFESAYAEGEARHYLFFSWENWMQRIPRDGTVWDFENMCWHRAGNCCWNGTESIHGRSTWGELEFRLTSEQRARILKPLLATAYRQYAAEKRCQAGHDGCLVHWADDATGDPEFHVARVKPLAEQLDSYGKLISADMTEATVFWLEDEALPKWQDVLFEVERRRAAWLLERNAR